jgi:hypothetical protein
MEGVSLDERLSLPAVARESDEALITAPPGWA